MLPPAREGSAEVANRVMQARLLQKERYQRLGLGPHMVNAQCPPSTIEEVCQPKGDARRLLAQAADSMALTARGYHRILKVARTLADLAGKAQPGKAEMAEALSYRLAATSLVM